MSEVDLSKLFRTEVKDASAFVSLTWDQMAALKCSLKEAEQLKAAQELLGTLEPTVSQTNKLLSDTKREFTNHEKENVVRLVKHFTDQGKQFRIKSENVFHTARFNTHPRSDANTLQFDIDARKDGGKRIMRSFLPDGLSVS